MGRLLVVSPAVSLLHSRPPVLLPPRDVTALRLVHHARDAEGLEMSEISRRQGAFNSMTSR